MSKTYSEGRLTFQFPDDWSVCRPGMTSYYSARFQCFCGGCKETDFAMFDPQSGRLWLLEVKDYAAYPRSKSVPLPNELAQKVRDALALLTASVNCDQTTSQRDNMQMGDFARTARAATSLGVVLHCEPQPRSSSLFPAVSEMANVLQAIRVALNPLGPTTTVKLARKGAYAGLPWAVT